MHLNLSCPAVSQLGRKVVGTQVCAGQGGAGVEVGNRCWEKQGREGVGKELTAAD